MANLNKYSEVFDLKPTSGRSFERGSERSATVKKQSGINGLLPALRVGPFHLFRLHLDLRSDVLKGVTVTFPQEKCCCTFPLDYARVYESQCARLARKSHQFGTGVDRPTLPQWLRAAATTVF